MAVSFGPFAGDPATDPSANLGEDFYMDTVAPAFNNPGVMGDPLTTDLKVSANSSGMQVFVAPGRAVARGVGYYSDATQTISIPASSSQARIDRVVLRFNRSNNTVSVVVLQGTPASNPVAPSISRTIGGTWDIQLAQVTVAANSVSISAVNVLDEREFVGSPVIPCLSSTRPSSTTVRRGQLIYETDTNTVQVWNGSGWVTQTPNWIPRGVVASVQGPPTVRGTGLPVMTGELYELHLSVPVVNGRKYMVTGGAALGYHGGSATTANSAEIQMYMPQPSGVSTLGAQFGSGSSQFPLGYWNVIYPGFHYYAAQGTMHFAAFSNTTIDVSVRVDILSQRTDTSYQIPMNSWHLVAYDVGV